MTAEQRLAFTTFRAAVAPLRLRVKADAEGFPIAPGRYGQLEWYGDSGFCAVWTDRPRLFSPDLGGAGGPAPSDRRRRDACDCPDRGPGRRGSRHPGSSAVCAESRAAQKPRRHPLDASDFPTPGRDFDMSPQ
jgi:hypothetical protein